ncbi:unnamed protein product [Staurois parvus]|uniref:Uncharacterized protein n=1 Tax=Staurois parvus TaxID=386267 RepID=A0ABN9CCW5_9NEOB|nr:unnamed protein product [Staurois parvus]
MTKWKPSRSVRRPESGTWQSGSNGRREQWEVVQGPRSHCGTSISGMRSRYGGPWQITCLAAAMGGP